MHTHRCCAGAARDPRSGPFTGPGTDRAPHRGAFARRALDIAGWLVPGAILTLLPKCPACLAAYLAAGTGFGLSLPLAAQLRVSLLILCTALLIYLAARRLKPSRDA